MPTLANLKTRLARDLRDTSNKTFDATTLGDLINSGIVEVGRISPMQFRDRIFPSANTLSYDLGTAIAIPKYNNNDKIEVMRVELWNDDPVIPELRSVFAPRSAEYANHPEAGWSVWNGKLYITRRQYDLINIDTDSIVVYGYAPWRTLANDLDEFAENGYSPDVEHAALLYARIEAIKRLLVERDLFTQWQTKSGNSDVTPAALMNGLALLEEDWRRKSRAMFVMREAP